MTYADAKRLADVEFSRAAWRMFGIALLILYAACVWTGFKVKHQRDVFGHVACTGAVGSTYSNALCEQLKAEGWTP